MANFSEVESLAPRLTPNLQEKGLYLVCPLSFDMSGMGGSVRKELTLPGSLGRPNLLYTKRYCTYFVIILCVVAYQYKN
jgi:hypothetical protein